MPAIRRFAGLAIFIIIAALPTAAFAAAPSNDTRSGAAEIDALPYSTTQNTADASADASDPRGCYSQAGNTVWYRYTAQADGRLVASTAGSGYSTQIEVLERSGPSLTSLACRYDDRPNNPGVAVAFPVVSGRTYLFVVGRPEYGNHSEDWTLKFSLRSQPTVDVRFDRSAFVDRGTGAVTLTGTATCSADTSVSVTPSLRQGSRSSAYASAQSYLECTPTPQLFNLRVPKHSQTSFGAGKARLVGAIEVPGEDYRQEVDQEASLTVCTLIGTVGDDELTGTSGADRICALHGDDMITARGGNDVVFGGPGRDEIRLGGGNDWAAGGEGGDFIAGQRGNDTLLGGAHRDKLVGGKGYDRCTGGKGRDAFRSCEARRR